MFKSIAAKFVKLQRTSAYFLAFLINICLLMAQIPLYFLLSLFSSRIYSESLEFSSICVWVTWPDEFVQSFLWQLMAAMFEIQFCCPRLPVLSSQKPGGWELAENQYLFCSEVIPKVKRNISWLYIYCCISWVIFNKI